MDLTSVFEFSKHLLVTLAAGVIVDLLMRRRKVGRANEEVQEVVHKLIADRDAQNVHRIDSIITSVARKHHLSEEKLYSTNLLVDEAINRILGDPFISAKQKQEYCAFSDRIKKEHAKPQIPPTKVSLTLGRRKDIGVILAGAILGAMLFSFLGTNISTGIITLDTDAIRRVFWMAAIAITVPALFLWLLDLYGDLNESKEGHPGRRTKDKLLGILKRGKRKNR
jgi:hypothetical protein